MEHPRLSPERTRIEFKTVLTVTKDARLIQFESGVEVWVPLSMSTIHWGLGQIHNVIDIETWFYKKRIEGL